MKTLFNNFRKWSASLTKTQVLFWSSWLVLVAFISWWQAIVGLVFYVMTVVYLFGQVKYYRAPLVIVLIGALVGTTIQAEPSQAGPQPQITECAAIVIGGLVIVVGGIVVYDMVHFCRQHFPPPNTPAPPTTPAPTNSPPTNNVVSWDATSAGNYVAPKIPQITIHTGNLSSVNISSFGWVDNTTPNAPATFQDYFTLQVEASSDLINWTNGCTVSVWLSSNSVESVIYDGNGLPCCTNWCPGNPYVAGMTNTIPFSFYNPGAKQMFFRPEMQ